MGQNLANVR